MQNGTNEHPDVAIVGGGLAGLAAAAYIAKAGRSVAVYERSSHVGGRAITTERQGFRFNLGPHALYRAGAAARVLRDLGVTYRGQKPPLSGLPLPTLLAAAIGFITTRVPGAMFETALPTRSTTAEYSWPSASGSASGPAMPPSLM